MTKPIPASAVRRAAAGHAPPRLYALVRDALAEQIGSARIPPGSMLHVTDVAHAFGISRAPAAMALDRLAADHLVEKLPRRGYRVRGRRRHADPAVPTIHVPPAVAESLARRRWSERVYPQIEREVAASLFYGRFRIVEMHLAEHLGVSRTVAHEIASRLQEAGLVERARNGRWYAGPLTAEDVRAHYEVRWLMEPAALVQSAARIDRRRLVAMRSRLDRARSGLSPDRFAAELHAIERALHVDLVLDCDNAVMRRILYRSQLPLIASHFTFELYGPDSAIPPMLDEHAAILDSLIEGDVEGAGANLATHLHAALDSTLDRLSRIGSLPRRRLPPFLIPED